MSFYLDIVVPKEELGKVDLEEQLIEWAGQKFSQDPVKYLGKKALIFEQLTSLKYHCKLTGLFNPAETSHNFREKKREDCGQNYAEKKNTEN